MAFIRIKKTKKTHTQKRRIARSVNRRILLVFTHAREVVAVLINEYVVFFNGTGTYVPICVYAEYVMR